MKEIIDLIANINKTMREFGFNEQLVIGNDHIQITEKEVIMKLPFTVTVKLARKDFEDDSENAIAKAINEAIGKNKAPAS